MKRRGRGLLIVLAALALAWAAGHWLLDARFPEPGDRRDVFPDPMPDMSLRAAFDALPADAGGRGHLRLLEDNGEAWAERWRFLAGARQQVDISYFILKRDVFGAAFLGHLIHKAQQGVRVRVALDGMGTRLSRTPKGNDYLDALVHTENVTARLYRPLRFRILDMFLTLDPSGLIAANHDKVLLVDGRQGITGGRNISAEYFASPADDAEAFLDVDLLLSNGEVAAALAKSFATQFCADEAQDIAKERIDMKDSSRDLLLAFEAMDAWLHGQPVPPAVEADIRVRGLPWLDHLHALPHLRGALGLPRAAELDAEVRLLDSSARLTSADDPVTRSLIRLVKSARREILIQSPYLVLPREAVEVLRGAAERGVEITVLTNGPGSSDNALSQSIFQEQWPALLAYVPRMRLFVRGDRHNLHGKLAVIDRELCLVGTYNLDPLSMAMNSELIVALWSPRLAGHLLGTREALVAAGPPQMIEYTLRRDAAGRPLRDREGRPLVASGAGQHAELPAAVRHWGYVIRAVFALPVDWSLFREGRVEWGAETGDAGG